mmetsp:Transcript_48035/g.126732  ORF Transcript_48035/g.126732 Transcript_48035/m.126732 type:complete len:220 (-) Transcript_48035:360-1019(-)
MLHLHEVAREDQRACDHHVCPQVASTDPLKAFSELRAQARKQVDNYVGACPLVQGPPAALLADVGDTLLGECHELVVHHHGTQARQDKPRRVVRAAGRWQATITSRQVIDSITWYRIQVLYNGVESTCHKRYSDFAELDRRLRLRFPCPKGVLVDLPQGGCVGLRHRLDLGTFNERRQDRLQQYLDKAVQVAGKSLLQCFFLSDEAMHCKTVVQLVAGK